MAIVQYGNGVSQILGKIAGNVYSKNRYSTYIRNKTSPVQPRTEYQLNQRAVFAAISATWRSLTPAQQLGWNSAASSKTFVITNRFGNAVSLSGATLFNQLNLNLTSAGQTMIMEVPSPVDLPVIEFKMESSVTSNNLDFIFETDPSVGGTYSVLYYATPGLSAGVTFVGNRYRLLAANLSVVMDTLTADAIGVFIARFGNLVAGSQIFGKVIAINNATGQASVPAASQIIVGS